MVGLCATKLSLPQPLSSLSSLLFDPLSLSLALLHSDSSVSLYPSFSLSSSSSAPSLSHPQTLISPPSSSAATFLRLQGPNPSSAPRTLFFMAAPHLGGASVLLRFWILKKSQSFVKTQVVCGQRGMKFDGKRSGVVFDVNHGVSIKVVGSINVFAMYSVSNGKVWVFSAKMADQEGEDDDGVIVKLMKCAVIDCCRPVFSISVSFGFLILGEENGVRVFPLRPLVKGKVRKHRPEKKNLNGELETEKLVGKRPSLRNGEIRVLNGVNDLYSGDLVNGESSCNGTIKGKIDKHSDCAKLRSLKLRQDSREGGTCFVPIRPAVENHETKEIPLKSAKAVSIEALSPHKFLILDSLGDLHILCLSNHVRGSEIPSHQTKRLTHSMKVQKLAALPDTSTRTPIAWASDGHHTVHMMTMSDVDTSMNESDRKDSEDKSMQISVPQAIFSGEKIQDIIPFAANAIMIIGEGSIFAYAIS